MGDSEQSYSHDEEVEMKTLMDPSRAQFLQGNFGAVRSVTRPPWALDEGRFIDACTRCGDCVGACPEKIIQTGRGGFPIINFARGECTFCGDCAAKCKSGALGKNAQAAPWSVRASIAPSCLALQQVVCRSCGEACPSGAIRFRISLGSVARPQVDAAACTGCGACHGPCPVGAVAIGELAVEMAA